MTFTIVAVDDEDLNLQLIEAYLDGFDYDVKCFPIAVDALNYLRSGGAADAVLLDRMMPALDGLSFLKQMRAVPSFGTVPVIIQTAAAVPSQIAEGIAAGAYYYLTKPYSKEVLTAVLARALSDYALQQDLENAAARVGGALREIQVVELAFRTPAQVSDISFFLASLYPDRATAMLGIRELMLNAVEHGNLSITYQEKSILIRNHAFAQEVERRLRMPTYSERRSRVKLECMQHDLVLTIEDMGDGFDWARYVEFDPARAGDPHGRGIMMSRLISFDVVDYVAPGNKVISTKRR